MIKNKNILIAEKKILFTLLITCIYLMGTFIPLPFSDITHQYSQLIHSSNLALLGAFSGANYVRLSIFSVGLTPLMFVMVIIQFLGLVKVRGFESLSSRQVEYFMQILTLIFTVIQSIFLVSWLDKQHELIKDICMVTILTAGSCLVIWLCYKNMKYGVGASAPVILTSILNTTIPNLISNVKTIATYKNPILWYIGMIISILALVKFWLAFNKAFYPLKVINPMFSEKDSSFIIPIGLNLGAMMMYMVGMALLTFPMALVQQLGRDSFFRSWKFLLCISVVIAIVLYYFFTFVSFDPKEKAKEFRNSHLYIKDIPSGKPTQKYLLHLILILSIPGAILNTVQLIIGIYGNDFLGKYSGFVMLPLNITMITIFMNTIKDQVVTLLFPYKYDRLRKEQ